MWLSIKELDTKMIHINLLDWRSKRKKILNNRFFAMTAASVLCALVLLFFVNLIINNIINNVKSEVAYLDEETASVESKIAKIKDLEDQKKLLLSRRKIIEGLEESRSFTVRIFDNLARIVPTGAVFTDLTRKGDELFISGFSDSNSAISVLLRNIQRLKWVKDASLSEIKAGVDGGDKMKNKNLPSMNRTTFQIKVLTQAIGGSG
mgnify:FL=1